MYLDKFISLIRTSRISLVVVYLKDKKKDKGFYISFLLYWVSDVTNMYVEFTSFTSFSFPQNSWREMRKNLFVFSV